MTTLRDIADELGLAVSVVSRALSPDPEKAAAVAPATRRRIQETAVRMQYRKNTAAAALRKGRNIGIGVWLPEARDRLVGLIAKGVGEGAMRENLPLFLSIGYTEDVFSEFMRMSSHYAHSGLISYAAPFIRFPELGGELRRYCENGGKMVMLSCYFEDFQIPGAVNVGIDDEYGGFLAGAHFRELAVSELCFYGVESKRYRGVCRGYGGTVPRLDTPEQVAARLDRNDFRSKPLAFAAASDSLAAEIQRQILQRGLTPGREVLIIGYNDSEIATALPWPLTTVRQDMYAVGLAAADSLARLIRTGKAPDVLVRPELIRRATA